MIPTPLDVYLLPSLVEPDLIAGRTAVVIDVLRASTMIVHALVNAFVIALAYWGGEFQRFGLDSASLQRLPTTWLAASAAAGLLGATLVWLGGAKSHIEPSSPQGHCP